MMNAEALLDALMDSLPDAIFFKDRNGTFVRINRVLASWYGLKDPAEAVGKSEADFYPQEFARATLESERALLKTGVPVLDQRRRSAAGTGRPTGSRPPSSPSGTPPAPSSESSACPGTSRA